MNISKKDWDAFVTSLSKINKKASESVERFVNTFGLDDTKAVIDYAYAITQEYGNASASLAALMYDTISELEGKYLPAAEMAENASYGDVAKAVNGVLKTSRNASEISGAVGRLVKRTGQDTMLQNGIRDRAEFAWIPVGDNCPFCIMLASNGWQPISKKALKKGHAEHIHSNCDCTYMVRHSENTNISGYDPEKYQEMYYGADGSTPEEKINSMRRMQYKANRDEINAQKRAAYAERIANSSEE